MPPKRKMLKMHCHCKGTTCNSPCTNPHVVLQPLMRDASSQRKYRFTALPSSAALYNRPTMSDIKLKVGDETFFAHRNILTAASDVMATMLSKDWTESSKQELILQEEPECVKIFDRFLYFMYSGNIVISDQYVVPLFLLADKYNIKSLYDECTKVIEDGLKVFFVQSDDPSTSRFAAQFDSASSSTSSDSSDSSDFSEFDGTVVESVQQVPLGCKPLTAFPSSASTAKMKMVASETYSVSLVLKMLHYCQNERIRRAALFNLEARVGNQICQGNYNTVWNDLDVDLVSQMLADSQFFYPEYLLFRAAIVWLNSQTSRGQSDETVTVVLTQIRYPLLSITELYNVEKDEVVQRSSQAFALVQEAMKFQLFKNCCSQEDRDKWVGSQFEPRIIRQ